MIKSYSTDQSEILQSILDLNGLDSFDADLTYGNGSFYKSLPEPEFKYDIDPQFDNVIECDSRSIPVNNGSFRSVVFDPPFMTYIRSGRTGNGNMAMAKRFGGYWRYEELEDHYSATIRESHRILQKKGLMIFKCQDIVHNHKLHPTHINIMGWSEGMFRLKDLFVLTASHRMAVPQQKGTALKKQKHARIHHSYFMVFEKL